MQNPMPGSQIDKENMLIAYTGIILLRTGHRLRVKYFI